MTKEELIQFLKDNLRVNITDDGGRSYYSTGIRYTIELKLDNETISEDYITVYTNDG